MQHPHTHTHTHTHTQMDSTTTTSKNVTIQLFTHNRIVYTIQIGKNKHGNDELLDTSSNDDIWFHIHNNPSSHVILKNPSPPCKIPHQVITRCACICKATTRASNKCEIMYTPRRNIKKTDIIGQVATTAGEYKIITI